MDVISLYSGTIVQVHDASFCVPPCAVHSPSNHPLKTAELLWSNALVMFFRRCEHGVVHPDPDSIAFMLSPMGTFAEHSLATVRMEIHKGKCDGCCGYPAGNSVSPGLSPVG